MTHFESRARDPGAPGPLGAGERPWRELFERSIQFMSLLDPAGRVLDANRAALEAAHLELETVAGEPFWKADWWAGGAGERDALRRAVERAAAGAPVSHRAEVDAGGGARLYDFVFSPVRDGGGNVRFLVAEGRDISAFKRAEASLEEAVAHQRAVLRSTLDPVITIDDQGIVQSASNSLERVFGWRPDELIGRNISLLMPEPHRSAHDGHLHRYRQTRQTNILGVTREFEGLRKDGTRFPLEISVSRVELPGRALPLFTGILHDISERKRAEVEVRLLLTLTLAISEAESLDQSLLVALRVACQTTGWDYGEAWLPSGPQRRLRCRVGWAHGGEAFTRLLVRARELDLRPGEGLPGRAWVARRPLWIPDLRHGENQRLLRGDLALELGIRSGLGLPILSAGAPVAVMAFFLREPRATDARMLELVHAAFAPLGTVIRRRAAEDELELHGCELQRLVDERTAELARSHESLRLSERLAAIGTLAAGLGHDMNNVLLPVRCNLDVLAASHLPEAVQEPLRAVRRSVAYLQQLSDGLHRLALETDVDDGAPASTRLSTWWEQNGALLRQAVPSAVGFEALIPAELPPVAVAPHRLTQAVLNLVVNATEAVGGKGHVRVWAELAPGGERVRLAVTDDGCGMSEEVRRRALEPFYTTKKRGLGTGLGLSLAHGLAQAAGGSIDIESTPGRGATVALELPIVRVSAVPGAAGAPAPVQAAIAVRDARTAALVATLLRAAGVAALPPGGRVPARARLLVVDATPAALRRARSFVRAAPGRRLVALGRGGAAWSELGATVVTHPMEIEELRCGLGAALSMLGPPGLPGKRERRA